MHMHHSHAHGPEECLLLCLNQRKSIQQAINCQTAYIHAWSIVQVKLVGPYLSCEIAIHVQAPFLVLDRYDSVVCDFRLS